MAKLDGKVVVITVASSGIGEATAETIAAQGATVAVAARRKERLDQLVEGIENAGGSTLAVSCDITDESQAHALIQRTEEEFGRTYSSTTLATCCSGRSQRASRTSGARCSR